MAELANARYEKFAQGIACGLSQRKAYIEAFPNAAKWKDTTVDPKASNLANDSKVSARIAELQREASSAAIMTAVQRKEWLSQIIQSATEETRDKLRAVDILNKMDGEYIDKVQMQAEVTNPFAGLSTEELRQMIGDE